MDSPSGPFAPTVGIDTFAASDLRAGTVLSAAPLEGARRPALVLRIDFGPFGHPQVHRPDHRGYAPEDIIGRRVVAVVNLPPKQVGTHTSRCLVLGAVHGAHVGLLSVPDTVPDGTRIH